MAQTGARADPTDVPIGDRRAFAGPVAIFDLDRTILPGSSLAILARALARHGLLPRRALARAAVTNLRFTRHGESGSTVSRVVAEVLDLSRGLSVAALQIVVDELRRDLLDRSRPELRRRILRHRAAGDHCIVLTASPIEIAQLMAEALGAQLGIGTRAEVRDGRFTGRLVGPVCHGAQKLEALTTAGVLPRWERSWAYSDSASDLPVLWAVANPVAVSPDRRLLRVATSNHWEILHPASTRSRR